MDEIFLNLSEKYKWYIKKITDRYPHIKDDLIQECNLALIKISKKRASNPIDYSKCNSDSDRIKVDKLVVMKDFDILNNCIKKYLNRVESRYYNLSITEKDNIHMHKINSKNEKLHTDEEKMFLNITKKTTESCDLLFGNFKQENIINYCLNKLHGDDRYIIEQFYVYGYSDNDISKYFNVSKMAINKRRKKIISVLRYQLQDIEQMTHEDFSTSDIISSDELINYEND